MTGLQKGVHAAARFLFPGRKTGSVAPGMAPSELDTPKGSPPFKIARVIYQSMLDKATCKHCAAADGLEGSTIDSVPPVPNPKCTSPEGCCRCVHVYVSTDEVPSRR